MTLRSRLIRLAHENEALRPHLLPLLKAARATKWENTVAGKEVRIRWNDHPDNVILIEELPSKGKKRLRRAQWSTRSVFPAYGPDSFILNNLIRDMKPSPNMSYEGAVGALKHALKLALESAESDKGRQRWQDQITDWHRKIIADEPREELVYFLEVEPSDYAPMEVAGADFTASVEWGAFKAYSPDSDFDQADPSYSLYYQSSPAAARKLYKILKADPTAIRSISWSQFSDWMTKNGVDYKYGASSWR